MASFFQAFVAGVIAILLTAATCALLVLGHMSPSWFAWVIFGAWLTITLHVLRAQARKERAA